MPFLSDFTINTATGDIRHASGTTVYSMLDAHVGMSDFSDDPVNRASDVQVKSQVFAMRLSQQLLRY